MPLIENQPDAVAKVYARSLFELAQKQGGQAAVEAVVGELEEIIDLARANPAFGELLSTPAVTTSDRAASLERIFKGRVGELTYRFLRVLNAKGRIAELASIAGALDTLMQAKFGRVEVDVFTAEPMHGDQIRSMKERLSRVLAKDVILHPYTEAGMIGGVKFRIGDQLVDASVATRLRKFKDQLEADGSAELRSRMGRVIDDSTRGEA